MAKAKSNGSYTLNGNEFVIREGDELPEGASFTAGELVGNEGNPAFDGEKAEVVEGTLAQPVVRAIKAAPENKAK